MGTKAQIFFIYKKFESEGSKNVLVFPETFLLIPRKRRNVCSRIAFQQSETFLFKNPKSFNRKKNVDKTL
jgi:hypothetical protein